MERSGAGKAVSHGLLVPSALCPPHSHMELQFQGYDALLSHACGDHMHARIYRDTQ